ncbi:hypothetical protein TNCV_405851 [Trichonephila clavipes]|nr:hypothetical protein TNCV_405851 [Trichonephila clavipes]
MEPMRSKSHINQDLNGLSSLTQEKKRLSQIGLDLGSRIMDLASKSGLVCSATNIRMNRQYNAPYNAATKSTKRFQHHDVFHPLHHDSISAQDGCEGGGDNLHFVFVRGDIKTKMIRWRQTKTNMLLARSVFGDEDEQSVKEDEVKKVDFFPLLFFKAEKKLHSISLKVMFDFEWTLKKLVASF